jgi:hypothetical protein
MFRLPPVVEVGLGLARGLVGVRESEPQAATVTRDKARSAPLAVLPADSIQGERPRARIRSDFIILTPASACP